MYKGTFSMISSNVYSKSMYKDFSKYIFYVHSKGFFNDFLLFKCIYTKNLKDLQNMYKLQSENMYKNFPFLFFKISLCLNKKLLVIIEFTRYQNGVAINFPFENTV